MVPTDTLMFKIDTNGDNLVDEDEFMAWATRCVLFLSAAFARVRRG